MTGEAAVIETVIERLRQEVCEIPLTQADQIDALAVRMDAAEARLTQAEATLVLLARIVAKERVF